MLQSAMAAMVESQRVGRPFGPDDPGRRGCVSRLKSYDGDGRRKERSNEASAPFYTREARAREREDLRLRVRTRHRYAKNVGTLIIDAGPIGAHSHLPQCGIPTAITKTILALWEIAIPTKFCPSIEEYRTEKEGRRL